MGPQGQSGVSYEWRTNNLSPVNSVQFLSTFRDIRRALWSEHDTYTHTPFWLLTDRSVVILLEHLPRFY
jgi:hypothetical protein